MQRRDNTEPIVIRQINCSAFRVRHFNKIEAVVLTCIQAYFGSDPFLFEFYHNKVSGRPMTHVLNHTHGGIPGTSPQFSLSSQY